MSLKYNSHQKLVSGLPLGGLGCGTLQFFPDGTRGVFTGLNNWENPLGKLHWFRPGTASDYRVANPFAIFVETPHKKIAKLLQKTRLDNCPVVRDINLTADFPVGRVEFKDSEIPVKIDLLSFSPFIKEEYKDSSLPCVIYTFKIKNPSKKKITVSLLASGINTVSAWVVGRYNQVHTNNKLTGIKFLKNNHNPWDVMAGNMTLSVAKDKGLDISYLGEWRYPKQGFRGNIEDRSFEAWEYFHIDGTLPNISTERPAGGERDEWMSALAAKFTLKPGQTKEVTFYYSWFAPNHPWGHRYEKWFKNSWDVASYVHKNKEALLKKTLKWQNDIKKLATPDWLKDALINNLYVYTSASWLTRNKEFSLYENTVKYPLMDSLDVRYYGTIPLVLFFPELEKITMELFRRAQHKDGRIPHDLGRAQLNCPSDGTSAGYKWKDLCTKYILMVWRDYIWTGDYRFLKKMYSSCKRAMLWEFDHDRDGDCLPENEGADSTYDLWEFYGPSSYTGSIFLASLLAMEKIAKTVNDKAFAEECRRWFERGRVSFEEKLWNGDYYIAAWISNKERYEASVLGQLNGQWYAHLLGLGYILPREHVKKAVKFILDLNVKASKFGAVNSVFPNGKIDRSSYHAENVWAGETYAFASLAIYEGFVKQGLDLTRRTWEHFAYTKLNPYSQPDVIFAKNGKLGDGELYLRNLAIWTVLFALAKHDKNISGWIRKFIPRPNTGKGQVW